VLNSDDYKTTISCEIPGFLKEEIEAEGIVWDKLKFVNHHALGKSGDPLVPRIWEKIAIPADTDVQINILSSEYIILTDYNLYPYQSIFGDQTPIFQQDMDIYNTNQYYPENIIIKSDPMIMRDYRVVEIEFSPIQYNPVTHELRAYYQIEFELLYNGYCGINILTDTRDSIPERMTYLYKKSILNYDFVSKEIRTDTQKRIIFIGWEGYTDCLSELKRWKKKKGYDIVCYDHNGADPESIKDYISSWFSIWWDTYVILVGDPWDPNNSRRIHYGVVNSLLFPGTNFPSDHYYSTVHGTDFLPDIGVGRISPRKTYYDDVYAHDYVKDYSSYEESLTNYAQKVVDYETNPYQEEDWFHNLTFAAGQYQYPGDQYFEQAKEDCSEIVYSTFTINSQYGNDEEVNNETLINAINEGCIIWNFAAHGQTSNWTGWASQGLFGLEHADQLTNNGLPVVYSIACQTGYIDYNVSISEFLLNKQSSGAISFLGFSSELLISMIPEIDIRLMEATFDPYNNDEQYIIGDIKDYMNYRLEGDDEEVHDVINKSAIVGDPTLEIWTSEPCNIGIPNINFDDDYIQTTYNSIVTFIGVDDSFYEVVQTTGTNNIAQCSYDIEPLTDINVTKHNYIPYQRTQNISGLHWFLDENWNDGIYRVSEGSWLAIWYSEIDISNNSALFIDGGELNIFDSTINIINGELYIKNGELTVQNLTINISDAGKLIISDSEIDVNNLNINASNDINISNSNISVNDYSNINLQNDAMMEISNSNIDLTDSDIYSDFEIDDSSSLIFSESEIITNNIEIKCWGNITLSNRSLFMLNNTSILRLFSGATLYSSEHAIWDAEENEIPGDRIIFNDSDFDVFATQGPENRVFIGCIGDEYWDGIEISNNPVTSFIRNCEISNIDHFLIKDTQILFENGCTFTNSGQLRAYNSRLTFNNSEYTNNLGPISTYGCFHQILESNISYNEGGGLHINYFNEEPGYNTINDSFINNNTGTGLYIYDSIIRCFNTEIEGNTFGVFTTGNENRAVFAGNIISNNNDAELISVYSCFADLTTFINMVDVNEISDDNYNPGSYDQYLLMSLGWDGGEQHDICNGDTCNNIDDSDTARFYPSIAAFDFTPGRPPEKTIFEEGIIKTFEENYETAKIDMKEVIDNYPETETAAFAFQWLSCLEKLSGQNYQSLREYLENVNLNLYPNLELPKEKAITSSYMNEEDYETAILRYEELINNPPSVLDSLFALIDEGYCYLKLQETGDRSLPEECTFKPKSFEEHALISKNLISEFLEETFNDENEYQDINDFVLYSNHPNPFNPRTTISYAIPQKSKIEISIYNIKGQKVKTLVNEEKERGIWKEVWNG